MDILAQAAEDQSVAEPSEKPDTTYAEHLLPSAIQRGIKGGRLHQGVYHASRYEVVLGSIRAEVTLILQG